jgi:hypothetical protein
MELVDILVLGTSAEKRVGSNPTEGILKIFLNLVKRIKAKALFFLFPSLFYRNQDPFNFGRTIEKIKVVSVKKFK